MTKTGWQTSWVRIVTTVLTLAVMAMIFCFSMENAEQSDFRSGRISDRFIRLFHPDYDRLEEAEQKAIYERAQHIVRKCAHFTEYMMLGFLLRLCLESWFGHRMRKYRILALIGFGTGTAYACSDEMHQLSIEGRSGEWTDVLVDGSGVLVGITLGTLLIQSVNHMIGKDSKRGEQNGVFQEK